jgi:hypothetical protein
MRRLSSGMVANWRASSEGHLSTVRLSRFWRTTVVGQQADVRNDLQDWVSGAIRNPKSLRRSIGLTIDGRDPDDEQVDRPKMGQGRARTVGAKALLIHPSYQGGW